MAGKSKSTSVPTLLHRAKSKVKRKGVHAKTRASKHKGSKNYIKKNVGQGY
jgi:hypothetical protein